MKNWGAHTIADAEEEKHERHRLERTAHIDVHLTHQHPDDEHGGDSAERETLKLQPTEEEAKSNSEENRQGRRVSKRVNYPHIQKVYSDVL